MRHWAFPASRKPAPPWLDQVRREQVSALYRHVLIGMNATWAAAGVLALILYQQRAADPVILSVWFGLISVLTISRIRLAFIYRRAADADDWRKWGARFVAGATISGIVWGVGVVLLMDPERIDLQLLIEVVLTAIVYGALAAFGRWSPAFFGFFVPAMAPSILWSLAQSDVPHIAFGVLGLLWMPAMAYLAIVFARESEQALVLGLENAALAADLRRQKEIADAANAAKSRFLAAASHDLRQPVHALGLFIGALKHEPLPANAARLVGQADAATASLDELFTSLLDVSRLDAGVVQPELRAVALRPMLERIVAEFAPEAERRGLAVRLFLRDAHVGSDAVMLERIARNLIANAVRHTEHGGVLVAVRFAGGGVVIEVWDTGPGIADDRRELVFREFYQGEGKARADGLGLGLAIVQRLCALLAHPLELHSRLGRGTLFRIRLPLEHVAAPTISARDVGEVTPRALVWVIDDERTVREGTAALLSAWGYEVRQASSTADILQAHKTDSRRPDVILCDYRLGAENGIAVIAALRAHLGAAVPAALVTGDTGAERLREADASGLPILHKPVANAKLRALVGNLARASV